MPLSDAQVAQFQTDGYLIVDQLLDETEIRDLRDRAEWVASGRAAHVDRERLQVEPNVAEGKDRAPIPTLTRCAR